MVNGVLIFNENSTEMRNSYLRTSTHSRMKVSCIFHQLRYSSLWYATGRDPLAPCQAIILAFRKKHSRTLVPAYSNKLGLCRKKKHTAHKVQGVFASYTFMAYPLLGSIPISRMGVPWPLYCFLCSDVSVTPIKVNGSYENSIAHRALFL